MANQPEPPSVPYAVTEAQKSAGMAIAALVCGIIGIVGCAPVGLVGLILGIIAVNRVSREPQRYGGKGMAIGGIVTGAVGMVVGLVLPALLVSILLPSLSRARELAKRSVCSANLRGTMVAIKIYANENNGAYPANLGVLVNGGDIAPSQLVCPSGGTGNYVYITGLNENTAAADTPVLYEPLSNHVGEGGNAAFVDGHVAWLSKTEYEEALADQLGPSP